VGERLKLNAFYRISRDSIDDLNGTLMNLDDFEVLDLSASYDINDSARIYARVENLLDEDYQEITGFFSPQRAIYIGIKLNFSQL
jgi:vitamin B12 transporter